MADQTVIPAPGRPMRATSIKGLVPQLPERGKIKIGTKGAKKKSQGGSEFQQPQKLDHFVITTMERGEDDNLVRDEEMHEKYGDKPTELPIRLLYDDPELNFISRYAAYKGRTLWCSGDGEWAHRLTQNGEYRKIECTCPLADPAYTPKAGEPPRCKMNGSLSVLIDGASGLGGVWKFRTTSYNSINNIMSSMMFFRQITGGILANIPLKLKVSPKNAVNPADQKPVLIYVVTLEYGGDSEALQSAAHQIALNRATTRVSIAEIETEARRTLALAAPANVPLPGDVAEDVVAEWYPEQYDEGEAWGDGARPTRAQFRAETSGASSEQPSDQTGEPTPGYAVCLADGEVIDGLDAPGAIGAFIRDMETRAGVNGLAGLTASWVDNERLIETLDGAGDIVLEIRKAYVRLETELKATQDAKKQSNPAQVPGQERPQAVAETPPPRSPPAGPGAATIEPSSPPTDAAPEDPVKFEGIRFGPGRGIDWRKTVEGILEKVPSLTMAQMSTCRADNSQLFANINLYWKTGMTSINAALAARDMELRRK
jgi:hypothetical protein